MRSRRPPSIPILIVGAAALAAAAWPSVARAVEAPAEAGAALAVPLPPEIEPPSEAMFKTQPAPRTALAPAEWRPAGRGLYLALVTEEAERQGLPPAVADAVAHVESSYNPNAVGGVGEIGMMQVLPSTAAMLGFRGPPAKLFEPATNVRYGVTYLARAWRLTGGQLCETLMKYRAGHGETRMSQRSADYCVRARVHLAAVGSPLADAPVPPAVAVAGTAPVPSQRLAAPSQAAAPARLARRPASRALWAAHDQRMKAIESKITASTLSIMR